MFLKRKWIRMRADATYHLGFCPLATQGLVIARRWCNGGPEKGIGYHVIAPRTKSVPVTSVRTEILAEMIFRARTALYLVQNVLQQENSASPNYTFFTESKIVLFITMRHSQSFLAVDIPADTFLSEVSQAWALDAV